MPEEWSGMGGAGGGADASSHFRLIGSAGLHIGRNIVEGGGELTAEARHRGDRGNSDQGGDQTIFDRRRAAIIFGQSRDIFHGLDSLLM